MKLIGNWRVYPSGAVLCVAGFLTALALPATLCWASPPEGPRAVPRGAAPAAKTPPRASDRHATALADFGRLPLAFEPNRGQTCSANEANCRIQFLSHGPGYTLYLGPDRAVYSLRVASPNGTKKGAAANGRNAVVEVELAGANPSAPMTGLDKLPGKSNYFLGRDPAKWLHEIPNYRRVEATEVYPGIGIAYYGTPSRPGQLEYDFTVAPGADPARIRLAVAAVSDRRSAMGTPPVQIGANGDLVVEVEGKELKFLKPVAYQEAAEGRRLVPVSYARVGKNEVALKLGGYDRSQPLVIDPVLSYSTFLGGSGIDVAKGIAVGIDGTAFIAGGTDSTDFPLAHALQPNKGGSTDFPQDAFVSKLSADGSTLLYSTYLGGSNEDTANAIAVDTFGNAYVTGTTISQDFPFSIGSFKPNCGCDGKCNSTLFNGLLTSDGFVVKLNPAGSALDYSGAIGALGNTQGFGIAVDINGSAFVTGTTDATACPVKSGTATIFVGFPFPWQSNGFQTDLAGSADGFIVKIDPTGSSLPYASYLGGSGEDDGFGIAADNSSNAYVTGLTCSSDFPVLSSLRAYGGNCDAFVTKADTATTGGASLTYSTYLGGGAKDQGNAISIDPAHSGSVVYLTGVTESTNFPTTAGVIQPACALDALSICEGDAFVTSLTGATVPSLAYSTYLGGTGADAGAGIAVDTAGNAYITGITNSTDFPTGGFPFQATYGGGNSDAFVAKINPGATALLYSSFLGGSNADNGTAITVDALGNAYVTGQTCSTDFPVHIPEQPTPGGNCDAFVSKVLVGPDISLSPSNLIFPAQGVGSTSSPQTITVTSNGDSPLILGTVTLSGEFTQTNSCSGATLGPGETCTITVIFAPTTPGPQSGTVTIPDNVLGSPQTVPLTTGQGTDFAMTVAPPSAAIFAGQSATYTVTLTPSGGFNGEVSLGCSSAGMPQDASCEFSVTSITLDGVHPANVILTITTAARVIAPPGNGQRPNAPSLPWNTLPFALAGLILVTAATFVTTTRRRRAWVVLAMSLLTVLSWAACSGGNPVGVTTGTPAGTYTISILGTSGTVSNRASATLKVN